MGNVPTSARPPTERLGEGTGVLEPLALCAARTRFFMGRGSPSPRAAGTGTGVLEPLALCAARTRFFMGRGSPSPRAAHVLALAALALVVACSSAPARTALQGDLSAL